MLFAFLPVIKKVKPINEECWGLVVGKTQENPKLRLSGTEYRQITSNIDLGKIK